MLVAIYIGNYYLYEKIINLLDETDRLIYLGDACDRGQDGIKIMQSLLSNDNITYVLGNHEQMFLNAVECINNIEKLRYKSDLHLYFSNGGYPTYNEYIKLDTNKQISLTNKIKSLPIYVEYINKNNQHIFLSHSGFDIDDINNTTIKKQELFNKNCIIEFKIDSKNFIWNRKHLKTEYWNAENKYENIYIVHGHTPTIALYSLHNQFKKLTEPVIVKYCNNHKIDIDLGTYHTNMSVLLNLDTFEPTYIK